MRCSITANWSSFGLLMITRQTWVVARAARIVYTQLFPSPDNANFLVVDGSTRPSNLRARCAVTAAAGSCSQEGRSRRQEALATPAGTAQQEASPSEVLQEGSEITRYLPGICIFK